MKILIEKNGTPEYEASLFDDDLNWGGQIFIGREDDCHVVLKNHKISRHHVALKRDGDDLKAFCISDNGKMTVDGKTTQESIITEGSKLKIDDYMLLFKEIKLDRNNTEETPRVSQAPQEIFDEKKAVEDESKEEATAIRDDFEESTEVLEEPQEDNDESSFDDAEDQQESEFSDDEGFNDGEQSFDDGGFGDDGGFDDGGGFDDDTSSKTSLITSFAKYRLNLRGIDVPFDTFLLEDDEVFIGRDPKHCKIILNDSEVSSKHAVLKKAGLGYVVEDLDSSNGTFVDGARVNRHPLRNGIEFQIGSTVFSVEVESEIIQSESDYLMPVAENQSVEIEEIIEEEVDFDELGEEEEVEEEKSFIKKIMNDPKKKRIAIIAVVGLALLMLLGGEDPPKKKKVSKKKDTKVQKEDKNAKKYPPGVLQELNLNYELARSRIEEESFSEAKEYINKVMLVDPNYKEISSLNKMVEESMELEERLRQREIEERERRERQKKIQTLVDRATKAVNERSVEVAESIFSQILVLDPENLDVPPLQQIIEAHKQEIEKKAFEEKRRKEERQNMVNQLTPAETLYLKNDWYKAIDRLEKYIVLKNIDEDLIKKATRMLRESRNNLQSIVRPLLAKARSFIEGEDLKKAYETYGEVLKHEPSNEIALNERDNIFESLKNRSRKIYREAIVAESLSLYAKAKEKLHEVKQVSPVNSEYYIKATEKLKNYLE